MGIRWIFAPNCRLFEKFENGDDSWEGFVLTENEGPCRVLMQVPICLGSTVIEFRLRSGRDDGRTVWF